jgi:hypothetical protein
MDAGPRRLLVSSILMLYISVMAVSMGCQEEKEGYAA